MEKLANNTVILLTTVLCFIQSSTCEITFLPRETLVRLPTVNGLQTFVLLDFAMLPETLQPENYTSTWTLPNGQRVSEESPSSDTRLLVVNGLGSVNSTKTLQHTTILFQGLLYSDAGVYRCSVQDNRNPGSPPTEGSIELQLSMTLTSLDSSVIVLDNALSVELSCDMSDYIRPDDQLQWFRDKQLIAIDEDRLQITFMNGNGRAQFGEFQFQPSRLSVLTISNPTMSDSGTYTCRVIGTRESVNIELLVRSSEADSPLGTTHTTIALSAVISILVIIILVTFIGIISKTLVVKRKKQKKTKENDLPEDHHLSPPQTTHDMDYEALNNNNSEQIMNRGSSDHDNDEYESLTDNYEPIMNSIATNPSTLSCTTNPAYGVKISANAGITVDTNIAYGLIESQQHEEL